MLQLDRVQIIQGDFHLAADFTIDEPGITAVIGPSGAGKSTLLAAIGGFLAPDAGRILWNATDLTPLPPGQRPVTTLFQDNNLFPHLTVIQNVGLGLSPALRLSDRDRASIASVLDRVGLSGLADRKPAQLSGGQQSRVALARALARNRPVVLLDEPFSALGPGLRNEMLDLVAATLAGTVLMVTHDPADALRIAPRAVFVANGTAHPPRDTKSLMDDPPPELQSYLGHAP